MKRLCKESISRNVLDSFQYMALREGQGTSILLCLRRKRTTRPSTIGMQGFSSRLQMKQIKLILGSIVLSSLGKEKKLWEYQIGSCVIQTGSISSATIMQCIYQELHLTTQLYSLVMMMITIKSDTRMLVPICMNLTY